MTLGELSVNIVWTTAINNEYPDMLSGYGFI